MLIAHEYFDVLPINLFEVSFPPPLHAVIEGDREPRQVGERYT